MGMSASAILIDIKKLIKNLESSVVTTDLKMGFDEFLKKVLPIFGVIRGDVFLTIRCNYWDGFDPYYGLMEVIEKYYGAENNFEIVHGAVIAKVDSGQVVYEIYEDTLGEPYPADEEDE
jgi:hypothetical protein